MSYASSPRNVSHGEETVVGSQGMGCGQLFLWSSEWIWKDHFSLILILKKSYLLLETINNAVVEKTFIMLLLKRGYQIVYTSVSMKSGPLCKWITEVVGGVRRWAGEAGQFKGASSLDYRAWECSIMSGGPRWFLQGVCVNCILETAAGCTIRRLFGVLGGDGTNLKEALGRDGERGLSGLYIGGWVARTGWWIGVYWWEKEESRETPGILA